MKYKNDNLEELLDYIDPGSLSYSEWVGIGMALKEAGYNWDVWDLWSSRDAPRYHHGECEKKWRSFSGNEHPVTAGTIVKMALDNGFSGKKGHNLSDYHELDWNSQINDINDDYVVTSVESAEEIPIKQPDEKTWNPVSELSEYIRTLFDESDNVGYVTGCWKGEDGKYLPTAGNWDRTAGKLLEELSICEGDIGAVFGDYNEKCGAWIRFNPLDGKGAKNTNVTDFRYALVESDKIPIEKQNGIIRELQLPVAALVFSGKKSIHAIVKVEASSYSEYKSRVEFLYNICDKNGLIVDRQNKNPSRLSRMPGIVRDGQKQFLMDTNIGMPTWNEWKDYIESVTDDLPDFENMGEIWNDMPELSPILIDGVLRQGHKLLLAGPSKAGKSFALIELAIAIAEGCKWLGWQCARGRVLYVNLELDRASCFKRVKDVYEALHITPAHINSIDVWNLRGKTEAMDKLAPKLIRRAKKQNYIAVIIDPIYKILTGDENSADQMAHFCNQFDKLCTELKCATIYCHHHSKGSQGGKRSMDRASGSGVFARDPDALIDLVELELTESIKAQQKNAATCNMCVEYAQRYVPDLLRTASPDDLVNATASLKLMQDNLPADVYAALKIGVAEADKRVDQTTAWRIAGTLREFPAFSDKNVWFKYPIHNEDASCVLKDLQLESDLPPYKKGAKKAGKKNSERAAAERVDKNAELVNAYNMLNLDGNVGIIDLAECLGISRATVQRRIDNSPDLYREDGKVLRKGSGASETP